MADGSWVNRRGGMLLRVGCSNTMRGEDFVIIGFVEFENPAFAATALSFLQGYVMDEKVPSSPRLRIQFDRSPVRQHLTSDGRS